MSDQTLLDSSQRQLLSKLSKRLHKVARGIHVLAALAWDGGIRDRFLGQWQRGAARVPRIHHSCPDFADEREALEGVARRASTNDHPGFAIVRETANSYVDAIDLLEAQGTPAFTELSQKIYGSPVANIEWAGYNALAVARYFIREADRFHGRFDIAPEWKNLTADDMRRHIEAGMRDIFGPDIIPVIVSDTLTAKATAGRKRVQLRADAQYSYYDAEQLLQHEVLIHSLTAINGRRQPLLPSLGLGAPRTTATQEGLATFAETITGSMDLARMKRISLRIVAIENALEGADFIEVFRFFLENGQTDEESFNSAARIFRGGDVRGRYPFTKDSVYAAGWLSVVAFFVWCLRNHRMTLAQHLFCGRVHLSDVFALSGSECDGLLDEPELLPGWFRRIHTLAGSLAMMNVLSDLKIEEDLCVDAFRHSGS